MWQNYSLNCSQFPVQQLFFVSTSWHFPVTNSGTSILLQKTRTQGLVHRFNWRKQLLNLRPDFSSASHLGPMKRKPRCSLFSMNRQFKSAYLLPPSPAPIIKASTQPTFLAPSSLLWPVGDCSAYSRDLHYVSYKSFHTFLVCVCVSSASMLKPTFGWRVLQFLQRHKIVAETLTKKLPDF